METGKWYKDKLFPRWLAFVNEADKVYCYGYGLGINGEWTNSCNWEIMGTEKEATKEEVESALIKEAERRGFVEGAYFRSIFDDNARIRPIKPFIEDSDMSWHYYDADNELRSWGGLYCDGEYEGFCSNPAIFKDGKWAEIVEHSIEHLKSKIDYCGDVVSEHIPKDKPTITILDRDRKELGKIYRTTNKYYLHIGNEIVECSSVEDCLTKLN